MSVSHEIRNVNRRYIIIIIIFGQQIFMHAILRPVFRLDTSWIAYSESDFTILTTAFILIHYVYSYIFFDHRATVCSRQLLLCALKVVQRISSWTSSFVHHGQKWSHCRLINVAVRIRFVLLNLTCSQ